MDEAASIDIGWRSALLMAVCMPVLLSALILLGQKTEAKAARYLSLFLMAAVIVVIPQIIGFAGFYSVYPGLTFAPFSVEMFLGPLLLLHVHHLIYQAPPKHLKWLFIPGVFQVVYYLWAFTMLGDYKNKWAYNNAFHEPYVMPVEVVIGVGLFVYCWAKTYLLSRDYEKYLENNQSVASEFKPVWVYQLLIASLVLLVFFIAVQVVPVFITDMSYVEEYPLVVLMMAILAWVGIDAIRKLQHRFPKIESAGHAAEAANAWQQKDWIDEAAELERQMAIEQWYLEPRLSLRQLAQHLGSNESYVSRTINQGIGLSFNQYINQWRIKHAKAQLEQPHQSVLNLALESGFNSKATFNRVFKKQVGLTPSQYRNKVNNH